MLELQTTRETSIENIVFITGLTRSGKLMLSPIVSSLERAEHLSVNYLMEQIPMMYMLGEIGEKVASNLIRYALDTMCHDISIGRNTNFRMGDITSVWYSCRKWSNIKKIWSKEVSNVFDSTEKKKPIYVVLAHDALWQAKLYYQALPQLKMIHITRHPIDIVHSWMRKGYGGEFFNSPRNATVTINFEGETLVYYARGWEKEYLSMNEVDRCIYTINHLNQKHIEAYQQLSQSDQSKALIIRCDEFLTDPTSDLDQICNFLDTKTSQHTNRVMRQERCPRDVSIGREKKFNEIKSKASSSAMTLLEDMIDRYENKKEIL